MRYDFKLNSKLEILHSVKSITMDDLYRVFFHIRKCHPNTLTSLSYSSKPRGRKFYLTDKGNEHVFTNKRDAYIYMVKAYGDFSN